MSSGTIAARELTAAQGARRQEEAQEAAAVYVMDELTQVYQSGARARALIPRMPVQDGINIIDFGTLYSHSFHPLGGIDGDDELHGFGMNF